MIVIVSFFFFFLIIIIINLSTDFSWSKLVYVYFSLVELSQL